MRVVTWNMNHCFRTRQLDVAWRTLQSWRPAFAFLQETRPPQSADLLAGHLVYEPLDPPRRSEWGTAIWSPVTPLRKLDSSRSHRGACVVAEVDCDGGALTLISLYGLLESLLGTEYSITTLHRLLSDLTVYLEDPKRRGRIILAGDFNANEAWDRRQRHPTHRILFDRVEAFGLRSVLPYRAGAQQTETWSRPRSRINQLDYIFASEEIATGPSAWVDRNEALREFSDHWPVWSELLAIDWEIAGGSVTSLADRIADADYEVVERPSHRS